MLRVIMFLPMLILLGSVEVLCAPQQQSKFTMNQRGVVWDQNCDVENPSNEDETKRAAIERAWAGAFELASTAWTHFSHNTLKLISNGPLNYEQQENVNKVDPAYVQLFALDWSPEGVERITTNLERLAQRMNADPGTQGRPTEQESRLHISCNNKWVQGKKDWCKNGIALTVNPSGDKDDSDKKADSNEDGISEVRLNLCPRFWWLPRFDKLKATAKRADQRATYLKINDGYSDASIILHELSHVWWLGNMNARNLADVGTVTEVYTLHPCAELAWDCGYPIANNPLVIFNADTYGQYCQYLFFFLMIGNLWPEDLKVVKLPVEPIG